MTPVQAVAAIETTFKTAWGTTTPIAWDNAASDVPAAPFARLTVHHTVATLLAWDGPNRTYQRGGIVWIQVFTKLGVGRGQATTLANQAASIFEGRQLAGNEIDLYAATLLEMGDDGNGCYQVNVKVPFSYTETRTV